MLMRKAAGEASDAEFGRAPGDRGRHTGDILAILATSPNSADVLVEPLAMTNF